MLNFIFGLIIGGLVVWLVVRRRDGGRVINPKMVREKRRNLEKVLELAKKRGEIANDDVERLLGVSDATATNYLQELENEGKVEQIGEEGRFVRYRMTR